MPSNQSYSIQREQLMQLKHFLQQFDNEMQQKLSEYKQRIASLRETGLPIETAEKFDTPSLNMKKILTHYFVYLIKSNHQEQPKCLINNMFCNANS
jgi:uncharacterized protein (DUF2344 family)